MEKKHRYQTTIKWTGNLGEGTSAYTTYSRNYILSIDNKPDIAGSSDAAFKGDISRHNPEDFLLSSLSSCHMLWYLHLCADAGVIVLDYIDSAEAIMTQTANGSGYFESATLKPLVTVADATMIDAANRLHQQANEMCFIANSVNFPVNHAPRTLVKENK